MLHGCNLARRFNYYIFCTYFLFNTLSSTNYVHSITDANLFSVLHNMRTENFKLPINSEQKLMPWMQFALVHKACKLRRWISLYDRNNETIIRNAHVKAVEINCTPKGHKYCVRNLAFNYYPSKYLKELKLWKILTEL